MVTTGATFLAPFLGDTNIGSQPLDIGRIMGALGAAGIGLGIVAVIGGIFALRRRAWGLALTGAILSLPLMPPLGPVLGILSIIFVSKGKGEFS